MDEKLKALAHCGVDVQGALHRLLGNTDFYLQCLRKFFAGNELEMLKACLIKKDYNAIFECAHAFKGVAGNLGLVVLHEQVSVIVEKCRYDSHAGIERDYKKLCEQFATVKAVVNAL